ncbi:DoxX family membrane protein [Aestuariimicrobium kwangyangense]|uniref:DoxX family membrane protein n=1 Tax=Aestuariimicrobium kwangyangense TaxID=396389 RepID=UPI0003B4061D|nr:DoxX family membrane protein [Aestuariimicrobium kwangyangense]
MTTTTPVASVRRSAATMPRLAGADRAFWLLRTVFTVAPIVFGLDKFFNVLTDWDRYLAPWINNLVPGTAHQAMLAVGVIEIVAGIGVAVLPRWGALLVAAWLVGIIFNLVSMGAYYDVALRDFGLFVGALALAALAFDRPRAVTESTGRA